MVQGCYKVADNLYAAICNKEKMGEAGGGVSQQSQVRFMRLFTDTQVKREKAKFSL